MSRVVTVLAIAVLVLLHSGDTLNAQEDDETLGIPEKYTRGGAPSKISPDLKKLSDNYKDYVGKNNGSDQGFQPSHPLMPVRGSWVTIDAVASGDSSALKAELEKLGLRNGAAFGRMVSGEFPVASLDRLQDAASLNSARPAYAMTSIGSVNSQGDRAMFSDTARSTFGLDGSGIAVGTLSDSFNCLDGAAGDAASNDLPGGIVVLEEESGCTSGSDEGRAMMQLIHDVAPGSNQLFHTGFGGIATFAQGIIDLRNAGADVIVDDVIYFAEPMFQDGEIARAVDTVVNSSVPYFSSAGNSDRQAYESPFNPSGQFPFGSCCEAHDFGGGDVYQQITIPVGSAVVISFQWDQPIFDPATGSLGSASDMDMLFVSDPTTGPPLLQGGCAANNFGSDPVEICSFINDGSYGATTFNILILKFSGPSPGAMKYVVHEFGPGVTVNEFDTQSGTIYGHACAAGAEAVGASFYARTPAFGQTPPQLEPFSSAGPCTILFDANGARKSTPEVRQKPEVVGPDGANTTFFGRTDPPCCEDDGLPNFFGTSASAPHVAAVAALMKEPFPGTSAIGIYSALENTAIDMNVAGFDLDTGFGFVNAVQAILALDGVPPDTTIDGSPPDPDGDPSPDFEFSGADNLSQPQNLDLECRLDGGGFSSCTSPHTVGPLTNGPHEFAVRAIDEAGNVDPTPATYSWTALVGDLTLSQQEVIANQDLTISGEHFSPGGNVCILEGHITLNNVPLKIAAGGQECPGSIGTGKLVNSDGTFSLTVRVHDPNGQVPTALLTPGTYNLRVIDTNGVEGAVSVNIPQRELEASPAVAQPGDIITIIGRHFIASNPEGVPVRIEVKYQCGPNSRVVSADPDVAGHFQENLTVPPNCAIPSSNTITAEIFANSLSTGVVEAITHELAGTPPGVTVSGQTTLQFRSDTGGRVLVEISCPIFNESTTPASDGAWQIPGVPPGDCDLTASAPGYLTAQGQVTVVASDVAVPPNQLLGGDANEDGVVALNDITGIIAQFAQPSVDCEIGGLVVDVNCDGVVALNDVTGAITNFAETSPQPF